MAQRWHRKQTARQQLREKADSPNHYGGKHSGGGRIVDGFKITRSIKGGGNKRAQTIGIFKGVEKVGSNGFLHYAKKSQKKRLTSLV